ncbi:hypothetical protein ACFXDE_20850 [Kitasatospora sp. NPDC059408]|uniref:variant leucine-rich repeat-containing protein n=1 Tax=Kitasatospora sp. NPDC059408 TaxID=3346823 RepID=UPI0036C1CF68
MDGELLCGETYADGCGRALAAPAWCHEGERPALRDGLPDEVLRTLAASTSSAVRLAVARYATAPADVVDRLVTDRHEAVRVHAVTRTRSERALYQAALRGSRPVRNAAAGNPHTPAAALQRLGGDPDVEVRISVVTNPAAPPALVDAAVRDPHRYVRWWALARTTDAALLRTAAASAYRREREWGAGNPHCPPDVLARLARDRSPRVRARVAANPACPAHLRLQLAEDADR